MIGNKFKFKQTRPRTITILIMTILVVVSLIGGCGTSKAPSDIVQLEQNQNGIYHDSADTPEAQEFDSLGKIAGRKTAQTADLHMKVSDVPAVVDQIIALSNQNGGYTVSSHIYRVNENVQAQLALKIPQTNLPAVINSISGLGEVTDKVITSQDVTEEFYDSQARLKVLQAKEQRLLGLMDKAADIAEIISVENELTKTRSEIEVLSGRLQYLSNITDFSQLNITLRHGVPGVVKAPQGTWGKAWQGLISSLNGVMNFASELVVLFFVILPWLVILGGLAWVVYYIRKRYRVKKTGD